MADADETTILRILDAAFVGEGHLVRIVDEAGEAALERGYLIRDENLDGFGKLTEAGVEHLDASGLGLPTDLRRTMWSMLPASAPTPFFDLTVDGDGDRARVWLNGRYTLARVRYADLERPALRATFKDPVTGWPASFTLMFEAGATRERIRAHPLSREATRLADLWRTESERTILEAQGYQVTLDEMEAASGSGGRAANEVRRQAAYEEEMRRTLNLYLGVGAQPEGGAPLMEALRSPDPVRVYVDQCEDDPKEICVRGDRVTGNGPTWRKQNLLLLAPSWDSRSGPPCRMFADMVVDRWEELRKAAAAFPKPMSHDANAPGLSL